MKRQVCRLCMRQIDNVKQYAPTPLSFDAGKCISTLPERNTNFYECTHNDILKTV